MYNATLHYVKTNIKNDDFKLNWKDIRTKHLRDIKDKIKDNSQTELGNKKNNKSHQSN
jgi:hypothetical protein